MIHPTALIDPSAIIHPGVKVGAYCVIGPNVEVERDTQIHHHIIIEGPTKIGPGCKLFPFASVGLEAQDKKYHGESSQLIIGEENCIREYVTINRGTEAGGGITRIGDRNWIMAYCHIAHDCQLGNDIVMANGSTLGGHVSIDDHAITGGMTGIHQFCKIGQYAITGGQSMITQDVVPYVLAVGNRARIQGVNIIGLERAGFNQNDIDTVNQAYRIFFKSGLTKDDAVSKLKEEYSDSIRISQFIDFINKSDRGICR